MVEAALAGVRPARLNAVSVEAFRLGTATTRLLDPLNATTIKEAESEVVGRWAWDRGDRFALRELGEGDRLHVYAVRRKSAGQRVWNGFISSVEHDRWLEHICTIDLNVIAGIPSGLVGTEIGLHQRREQQRPNGARMGRQA